MGAYHSPRSQLFSLVTNMPPPSIGVVMALLLAEEKVLVHSADASVASNVTIALRTLLFPLRWELLFLPVVPVNMLGFLGEQWGGSAIHERGPRRSLAHRFSEAFRWSPVCVYVFRQMPPRPSWWACPVPPCPPTSPLTSTLWTWTRPGLPLVGLGAHAMGCVCVQGGGEGFAGLYLGWMVKWVRALS